ncbi:MAG: hypothetical protein IJS39_05365 [Synergistaceae bacterium]|nr:hypothetical protein [Synergistaceae bacterium]
MPDQNLLDDSEDSSDFGTALDMPSFGETVDEAEQQEKEKTMNIREKLSKRKQGQKDSGNPAPAPAAAKKKFSGKGKSSYLTPVLIFLLLIVGVLLLLQIRQFSERITNAVMNSGAFDGNASGIEARASYDYAIDFILDPNLTERMAARGRDGWQVVGSRRTQDTTTGQYGYEFIFMRRLGGN